MSVKAPWVRILPLPPSMGGWLSGRKRSPAKRVSVISFTGSNPVPPGTDKYFFGGKKCPENLTMKDILNDMAPFRRSLHLINGIKLAGKL